MRIARHVQKLEEYVPGEQPKSKNVVKLNTNENPYPPSPKCAGVLKKFDLDKLRRYCDPDCTELRAALAKLNKTTPDRIFVGNGSDEVLSIAAKCFVENDEKIASLDPSYSLYKTLAAIRDVEWVGNSVPPPAPGRGASQPPALDIGNSVPPPAPGRGASQPPALDKRVSLFLLTNPNAPTGEFREPAEIARFAAAFKGVIIVDEAYADFARANCMALATAESNRNLIVMRTFSKSYSLAGLRVGYCVGPADLIRAMYKVKDSYNVDAIAQAVALVAVKDQKWMKANAKKVIATRQAFTAELEKRGWDVIPSESNFVFAKPPEHDTQRVHDTQRGRDTPVASEQKTPAASRIFAALRAKNIFVRYFKYPNTRERLRITIGTPEQMAKLLKNI